jgi:hypothetical protein
MRPLFLCLSFLLGASVAWAEPPKLLKSFSYMSQTVACNGDDQLLPFDKKGDWKMAAGYAPPGAGEFPSGNFYVRAVTVSHAINGNIADSYAVVGHGGPNGDHVSPWLMGPGTQMITYPEDAAPLFTAGEYFDLHARCISGNHWATMQIWYIPVLPLVKENQPEGAK